MAPRHPLRALILTTIVATAGGLSGDLGAAVNAADPATPVRFVVLGDFGQDNDGQASVAAAIKDVCAAEGCDFAQSVGDNIYMSGVGSVDDEKFQTHFEDHYGDFGFPMYVAIGDHDAEGDLDAMVAYTNMSEVWTMPDRWYVHEHGNVRFVVLDHYSISDERTAWAREAVGNATHDWVFVVGDVPYVSNGKHGNAEGENAALVESVVCDAADLYMSGDDHLLQWLPAPGCSRTEQIVSGAGAAPRPIVDQGNDAHFQQGDTLGFWWFEVDGSTLTGRAYDDAGTLLFERVVTK